MVCRRKKIGFDGVEKCGIGVALAEVVRCTVDRISVWMRRVDRAEVKMKNVESSADQ